MRFIAIIASLLAVVSTGAVAEAPAAWVNAWPNTDFSRHSVSFDSIRSGGPPRDGIPSVDDPTFVEFDAADRWLGETEPVIALAYRGVARAYPLQILIWHEIVNDKVADLPVAVTFCPLCRSALTFDRRVGERVLEFGTTGKLRKSDMVMYDRQTLSWWQQFTGEAIVGELTGQVLRELPTSIISYSAFKRGFPDGEVLSRDTGHDRPYGDNPYTGYDQVDAMPFALGEPVDERLPPMRRVLGIRQGQEVHLYPLNSLASGRPVNTQLDNRPVVILAQADAVNSALDARRIAEGRRIPAAAAFDRRLDGRTLTFVRRDGQILDEQTGSQWDLFGQAVTGPLVGQRLTQVDSGVHFAFAWLAFRPGAVIHQP